MLTTTDLLRAAKLAWLTTFAWCGLVTFELALLGGFANVHRNVCLCRVNRRRRNPLSVEEIMWAVDEACVWYMKRAACLQRSVVATWLLRRNGIEAELVIGYRPVPFESHAWVEVAGRVVNDRQQFQRFFTVLERL